MWYKNIAGRFFGLVTNHACDRRTDGQNYDSHDRASIAASRSKITVKVHITLRQSTSFTHFSFGEFCSVDQIVSLGHGAPGSQRLEFIVYP